ncbi:Phosphopantothenate--cysteine ligase [Gryllus bimaculatus]|nr:Phosphopantothenate--cysteine ligase [Gryllus bimaculatus]
MSIYWEEFYSTHAAPADFGDNKARMEEFTARHLAKMGKIALITSGGTTVPLEHNTVRFVDNFSAGTRGSASAEYFLQEDYAVIFLYRFKSLEPFVRHFMGQKFLDLLEITKNEGASSIQVKTNVTEEVLPILQQYQAVKNSQQLLCVGFTSLADYLWLLRAACELLTPFKTRALLYLAAAVSDFYIPSHQMPTHKMQSDSGPPTISLQLVPKMLKPLVSLWVPEAFVVSFKLETDETILISKARGALEKYNHKMVIANILQTRKQKVVVVTSNTVTELLLTPEEIQSDLEIEEKIVKFVTKNHAVFCSP